MTTDTDGLAEWIYGIAARIDGEWACCHSAEQIREGVADEPYCSGAGVAAEAFLRLAEHDKAAADEIDRLRAELAEQGQIVHDRTIDVSLMANDRNDWKRRHGELEADREKFRQAVYDECARQLANQREAYEAEIALLTERAEASKRALVWTGYFTADEIGPDIAPRITELDTVRTIERDGLAATIKRALDLTDEYDYPEVWGRKPIAWIVFCGHLRDALSTPEENG